MISKLVFGLLSIVLLLNLNSVYAEEELPIITIDFVSGNTIDLDKNGQMVRADVQIENYNPQDGYHFMQIIRLSDGEIIKDTEILPKVIEDNLFGVKILHYLDPDGSEENLLGDYGLKIYSEFGSVETVSTFTIIKSSLPLPVTQPEVEELETLENNLVDNNEESKIEPLIESESKIPTWIHDIFVWYAEKTITEDELITALEYLISQEILDVNN